ncbi:MAG: ATP-binding protein [Alphaproteobacteria bacterium]
MPARTRKLSALGQLSGGIAHDFNNLLMAISLNLEMAEAHAQDDELRDELAEAKDAVGKGAALTRRMLSFAQRGVLKAERFAPGARVRDIAQLLRRSLGEQVEVSIAVDPDPWLVEADVGELDSAIINLAVNARDAMPSGGRLDLSVANALLDEQEARRLDLAPGPHVRIRVADSGSGMDPEVLRRATEPFFTTKPQGEGTGLGLSSVYGFVRQSGGGLGIESQPGRGTTVTLLLPRAAPRAATAATGGDLDDMPAGLGERVLVVEDNDQVRRAVAGRLRMLGYDVVEAGRGAEAIAALEGDATIRLVLSDVVMPGGVDGFHVADWARAHRPDVGVLLVSGNMASDLRRTAHPSLRVLAKPYAIAELARHLRELVAS